MSDPITARLDAIQARLDAPGPWIPENDIRVLLAAARTAWANLALCLIALDALVEDETP